MLGSAGSPLVGLAGAAAAVSGWRSHNPLGALAGGVAAILSADFIRRVTTPHQGFERAFGPDWHAAIPPDLARRFLPRRWNGYLRLGVRAPSRANVVFWGVPGVPNYDNRRLLVTWGSQPAGVSRSGLGVIYLHAGGWQNFAKDTGTRPFFSYLCRQGHVVMDVDYRMIPETDMAGMLADVKHAVVWLKNNASRFGVDQSWVVLTARGRWSVGVVGGLHPERSAPGSGRCAAAVTPPCAASSFSMRPVTCCPTAQGLPTTGCLCPPRPPHRHCPTRQALTWPEIECRLFGARAAEVPQRARRFSPIAHAGPACPPTLLIHGAHDGWCPLPTPVGCLRRCAVTASHRSSLSCR